MTLNLGPLDRVLRGLLALSILVAGGVALGWTDANWAFAIVLATFTAVAYLVLTSAMGFDPLYAIAGTDTHLDALRAAWRRRRHPARA